MSLNVVSVNSSFHEEAIKYANRGIQVFPVVRNRDVIVVKWRDVATTDPTQIDTWWADGSDKNIGILTGPKSGIIVVHFKTPEALALAQEKGLPVTPIAIVSKGYHGYFRYKEELEGALVDDKYQNIELIGDGWYVIAPPSVLSQNPGSVFDKPTVFSWIDGKGLDDVELGDVPGWLLTEKREIGEETSAEVVEVENLSSGEVVNEALLPYDTALIPSDTPAGGGRKPISLQAGDWKAPILFEGAGVEEVKADLLPSWLGEYASAVSRSTQTPEGLAVMIGLSAVAACVQKRFEVCPYGDDYIETLSLWTVTVLQSSERKTPVFKAMTAPIYAWEKEQAVLLRSTIEETATQIQIGQKRIEKVRQQAASEADSAVRQGLVREISEIQANMPAEVRAPRLWVGDTTAESLQDLLADNGEKMAVLSDEGGIFEIMAGLYNDSKVNIDVFLQAYSGASVRVKRQSRDVSLERPALTFGLTVQPVVIEGFANGSKKQFRGKGALGRFLFCVPESMMGRRDIGQRVPVPPDVKMRYEAGLRGLLALQRTLGATGDEVPRMLELDSEAISLWENYARRVESMLGPGGELATMGDWGGKLPGTVLRIAGLLHLVEHGPDLLIVGKETLDRSIRLCNVLMGHTKTAFGLMGTDAVMSDAKKLFLWMQSKDFQVFTRTDCYDAFKSFNKGKLDKALSDLEERNIIKELMVPTKGKDAANYISNPVLQPTFG